jgi:Flp pilus assembly protein TadD
MFLESGLLTSYFLLLTGGAVPVWIKTLLLVGALAALVGLSIGVVRKWWRPTSASAAPADDDPRRTFDTPFLNVRPEIQYVGDDACAQCHANHAARYHRHPMGRSLAPLSQADRLERYKPDGGDSFNALSATFQVIRRDERVVHKEIHFDAQGKEIAAVEAEVRYALGSGRQGRSYLIERDGFLLQSPISWYSSEGAWDLSPGYKQDYFGFRRQITLDCLFCHSNQVKPVEHTINHYERPTFRGSAIGCERCHGPGQLHVERRAQGDHPDGVDYTIVDPRHLEPVQRDSVCQQCHLQGEVRIARRGRSPFDFRPGLPLHLFLSTFVLRPEAMAGQKSVGHVEQMNQSRCFQESKGRLSCISCHNPHELPAPETRVAFFRDGCLQCHESGKACSSPLEIRRQKSPADSCIDCHMPRGASANIVHAAVTDHRILSDPKKGGQSSLSGPSRALGPNEIPLLYFHRELVSSEDPAVDRELALAMIEVARNSKVDALAQRVGQTALPLLAAAVRASPDDVDAWEARGYAYWLMGRTKEALAASETALALAPRRELALKDAGFFAAKLGRKDLAVRYWKELLTVNPWQEPPHYNLAKVAAEKGEWEEALRECQVGLRIDPTSIESRTLVVSYYARKGIFDRAKAEFEALLALKPPKEQELRRWFAGLRAP